MHDAIKTSFKPPRSTQFAQFARGCSRTSGRVPAGFSIEVEPPVFRTPCGDRYGTQIEQSRRHWPGARRPRDCCAVAVSQYAARGLRPATLRAFTFAAGRLTRGELTTCSNFEACSVHECD
jgi:hypothetical protein